MKREKDNFDERIKMPKALRNLVFSTFGISGMALIFRGSHEADYTDSFLFLAGGVFSSFAIYGIASLIEDCKKSKTYSELWQRIKNKFVDVDK